MLLEKFVEETSKWWSTYFRAIANAQAAGNLDSHGGTVLFPNMLIVVNCAGHYVAELVGATEKYFGLVVKGMKNNRFIDT
jgi:hypothetical protein